MVWPFDSGVEKVPLLQREFRVRFEDAAIEAEQFNKEPGREAWMPDNNVITARYNAVTFFPRALFEQFRRLANIYFLVISILMMLGTYTTWFDSPITPWSTLLTLMVVVGIAMTKEGFEDWKRHAADAVTNKQQCHRFTKKPMTEGVANLESADWSRIRVGNLIKVYNNEEVPADIILLSSSEPFGNAYIETANIDGESNLKLRSAARTGERGPVFESDLEWISSDLIVRCELPNPSIVKFNGSVLVNGRDTGVDENNLLLRGCRLKNTGWAVGIVVYTGKQSKVMMNSRPTPSKLSLLEKTMNSLIFLVFVAQLILSTISFISYLVWYQYHESDLIYLCIDYSNSGNPILEAFCESTTEYAEWGYIITFFILYNNFIPISLYVTIEMCNYIQAYFIDQDMKMYHAETNTPAIARTSNMNSDLGMVEYIFSDKTGTLTENVMKFQKISFGGQIYSMLKNTTDNVQVVTENGVQSEEIAMSEMSVHTQDTTSYGSEFAMILSVCHTVVIDTRTSELRAESPDEAALVFGGENIGWKFIGRRPGQVLVQHQGQELVFDLLATIPFDSTRKRMSVVIRTPANKLMLLTKGADNIIFDLSTSDRPNTNPATGETPRDAINRNLQSFAAEGLRTLVLAVRDLSSEDYELFDAKWKQAERSSNNREQLQQEAAAIVENNLIVVGATGIEDKLQQGVPDTIAYLLSTGIKLWVLTGDKMETAINIGYSARLLRPEMILIRMQYPGNVQHVNNTLKRLIQQLQKLTETAIQLQNTKKLPWHKQAWKSFKKFWQALFTNDLASLGHKTPHKLSFSTIVDPLEDSPLIDKPKDTIDDNIASDHLALIVDGPTLLNIFGNAENEMMFLAVAKMCKTVIACRVSPEQKRLVVRLVKLGIRPRPLTLSVGDGANDVPMIQEAEIGVGISGKEGRQAVNSSDFALAQFRYLKRLLVMHGRWNYRRTSKVVLYSFYKNIVLALSMFFYTFFSGYSGQTMYDSNVYGMFNIVLSMPVVCFGIFDRDVPAKDLLTQPHHYDKGRKRTDLNSTAVLSEMAQAIIDAVVLFFLPYYVYRGSRDSWEDDGRTSGMFVYGLAVFTTIVIAMMLRVAYISYTWTWVWHFFFWGSLSLYLSFIFVYQYLADYSFDFYGVANETFGQPIFYALLVVTCFVSIAIKICIDIIMKMIDGSLLPSEDQDEKTRGGDDVFVDDDDDDERPEVTWSALNKWQSSLSEKDQQALGVQNMETNPMSSYNYDHVGTKLGPGASIQVAFASAGRAMRRAFGMESPQNKQQQQVQPEEQQQGEERKIDGKETEDEAA